MSVWAQEQLYIRSRLQKVSAFSLNAFKNYPFVKSSKWCTQRQTDAQTTSVSNPLKNPSPRRNLFRRRQTTLPTHRH